MVNSVNLIYDKIEVNYSCVSFSRGIKNSSTFTCSTCFIKVTSILSLRTPQVIIRTSTD